MHNLRTEKLAGNSKKYDLDTVCQLEKSPLQGMNIYFLGSSVTYGAASQQISFVEFLAKRNQFTYIKNAVSGTTLVEQGASAYISRLKEIRKTEEFDLFVCQLSTNDATKKKNFGKISDSYALDTFDTLTIFGAIEYIVAYVTNTWNCPIIFYTNTYYKNKRYEAMVELLNQIHKKWDIGIINLYTDKEFNDISTQERALYMADEIHPTKAGYLDWWVPRMEKDLYQVVANCNQDSE
jgi:lysophospholipase L1-like esterase